MGPDGISDTDGPIMAMVLGLGLHEGMVAVRPVGTPCFAVVFALSARQSHRRIRVTLPSSFRFCRSWPRARTPARRDGCIRPSAMTACARPIGGMEPSLFIGDLPPASEHLGVRPDRLPPSSTSAWRSAESSRTTDQPLSDCQVDSLLPCSGIGRPFIDHGLRRSSRLSPHS